ncbi:carboxymuconolactone decarboxylase family protein [Nitrosophilus kaiyonis]|uniref:carboxymuconolactone decarboxylase family protein n=1 Tax=Nitrosophilus kaiyonis TaxID=2930200 RepID=UPI0024939E13|nr:carboxymuconolactone decarboxylase family protein [Nitrosophilus kaiyonis]
MQTPRPEQVMNMMKERFGKLPKSIEDAAKVDPSLIVEQAISSKLSMQSEKNTLDPKTSTLIFLAAALALGSEECVELNTKAAKKMGATNEEILSVIRIVRHAAASSVVGVADAALKNLKEE